MFVAGRFDSRRPRALIRKLSFRRWFSRVVVAGLCWLASAWPTQAETYFVGFGANRYPHLSERSALPYCSEDVHRVAETLKSRCGVLNERSLFLFVEDEGREKREPTASNLREQLPEFLRKLREDDTLIMFGSCHGSRDPQTGRGYLQLADANPANPIGSSLDLIWLRDQLLSCPPRTVVLLLDACHAGSIGAPANGQVAPLTKKDFEVLFSPRQTPNLGGEKFLCALLSSAASETSALWLAEKQSLFTFWLCRGLEGAADVNGNGAVSLDELFEFTEQQVGKTAKYLARANPDGFQQTPVRFFLGSNHGNKELFPIQPDGVRAALKRAGMLLESLLTNHARESSTRSGPLHVTLLPITGQHHGEPDLSLSSTLGSVIRSNLEQALISHSTDSSADRLFAVVPKGAVQSFLDRKDLLLREVGTPAFAELAKPDRQPRVDAVIVGSYLRAGLVGSRDNRDRLQFEFRLLDVRTGQYVGRVSTSIVIDEEFRALLPESFDSQTPLPGPSVVRIPHPPNNEIVAEQTRTTPPAPATPVPPPARRPETPSRWLAPKADYPVQFFKVTKNEQGQQTSEQVIEFLTAESQAKQQPVFGVKRGDLLEFDLANPTDQWVAMLVYVDGVSVIGKQPLPPTEAREWLFPPRTSLRLQGWHQEQSEIVRTNGNVERQKFAANEFLVTAPPESVAGRQKLAKEIGQIQVIVYPTKPVPTGTRSAAVGDGAKLVTDYQVHRHVEADRSRRLAQYVFHYVDEADRKTARND